MVAGLRPLAASFVDLAWRAPAVATSEVVKAAERLLRASDVLGVFALLLMGGWLFSRMRLEPASYPLRL